MTSIVWLTLAVGAGCGGSTPAEPGVTALPAATVDDAHGLAERLVEVLGAGCTPTDTAAILQVTGFDGPADAQRVAGMLCRAVATEDRLTVLTAREVEGQPRVAIRRLGPAGFAYLELFVGPGPEGPRITDVHVIGAGLRLSERLAATPTPAARRRVELLQAVRDAGPRSEPEHTTAVEAYEATFPHDPSLAVAALDGLFRYAQYAKAVLYIDRLDKRVGGDPYLETLRGDVAVKRGFDGPARVLYEKAVSLEPQLAEGWWGLAYLALDKGSHHAAAVVLRRLRDDLQQPMDAATLQGQPAFEGFLASPEGKAFLAEAR